MPVLMCGLLAAACAHAVSGTKVVDGRTTTLTIEDADHAWTEREKVQLSESPCPPHAKLSPALREYITEYVRANLTHAHNRELRRVWFDDDEDLHVNFGEYADFYCVVTAHSSSALNITLKQLPFTGVLD